MKKKPSARKPKPTPTPHLDALLQCATSTAPNLKALQRIDPSVTAAELQSACARSERGYHSQPALVVAPIQLGRAGMLLAYI